MQSLRKMGGVAGLIAAATFVVGLVMFATLLTDYTMADQPLDAIEFLVDNQVALYVWNITITIVFGLVLVPFALAVKDRISNGVSPLPRISAVFGLIWSGVIIATGMIANISYGVVAGLHTSNPEMATTVWTALEAVQNGLGGGNEVLGGIWVLLVSIAALRAGVFSRWVNYLGIVMGVAGLITVIPPLEDVGAIFGLGLVVWFTAVGRFLLRTPAQAKVFVETTDLELAGR